MNLREKKESGYYIKIKALKLAMKLVGEVWKRHIIQKVLSRIFHHSEFERNDYSTFYLVVNTSLHIYKTACNKVIENGNLFIEDFNT